MILAFLQVAWAVARPSKEAPGEAASRLRWSWVLCHRSLGYAMPLLAFANIFLGFHLLALPVRAAAGCRSRWGGYGNTPHRFSPCPLKAGYYAAFAVWIFLFFLAFAVLSCMQGFLARSAPLKAGGGAAPEPMYSDDPSVNGAASPVTYGGEAAKRGPDSLGSQVELMPVVV